jgi:prepilin peptidase CpaA
VAVSFFLSWTALVIVLLVACTYDMRQRRIPNAIVLVAFVAGLALQTFSPSGHGLFGPTPSGGLGAGPALIAVGLMLIPAMLLWRCHFFGGGDAKLLTALSTFAGPAGVVPLLLATLCCGGLLALASSALQLRRASMNSGPATISGLRLPYALAIASGALLLATGSEAGILVW